MAHTPKGMSQAHLVFRRVDFYINELEQVENMFLSLRFLIALLCYLGVTPFSKTFAQTQLASGILETLPAASYEGIADRPVQV
ncbi:hypothetical protein [Microbulbifer sp. GL-2]|uniref:hypothetical protein n=1 Tax=Microbulbifer sp. GL-2 TaxID=2591606 RepID=UPI00116263AD|nr:hypothetical protein [Microbulbifer sp. GL-2]BBM01618.1 hypothetical protein GL2_16920 [Microbulbifer sp. GL-2]